MPIADLVTRSGLAAVLLAGAAPSIAQEGGGDRLLARVTACRAEGDAARRLACYDAAAERLDAARKGKDIVVLDRGEVREKRRALFGLSLPDIKLFGRDDDSEAEVSTIESTVAGVSPFGRGRLTVAFADGSLWRTMEPARFDPRKGDKVVVRRGALSNFRASFNGQSAVSVQRVR